MITRYLSDRGEGAWNCLIEEADGGVTAWVNRGFETTYDGGLTWVNHRDVPKEMSVNLLRLKNGNVLTVTYNPKTDLIKEKKMNGCTFDVSIYDPEMKEMLARQPLTEREGCYYIQNDRILRLKSGRILAALTCHPLETLDKGIESDCVAATYYSDDEGETWNCSNWVGENEQENMVVEMNDGKIYMFTRNNDGYMHYFVSADQGASWDPTPCVTSLRMPMAPFAIKRDPYTGYIFVVWDNSYPSNHRLYPRTPICLGVSRDEAKTWDFIMELDNNPADNYGYPAIHFMEDRLLIPYYENRASRSFGGAKSCKMQIVFRDEMCYAVKKKVKLF